MAPRKATKAKKAAAGSADAAGPKAAAAGVKKSAARKGKKAAANKPAAKKAVVATAASGRSRRGGKAVPDEPADEGSDNGEEPPPGEGGPPGDDGLPAPAAEVPAEIEEPAAEPIDPLTSVTDTLTFQYGLVDQDNPDRQAEDLIGKLDINLDPARLARIGYNASFYMSFDPDDDTIRTLVGTIDAWRIEKRTDAKPIARAGWINDFLTTIPATDGTHDHWNETYKCLRAIFKEDGVPKAVKHLKDELASHSLIFIQMVHTLDAYQKRGIMPAMLTLFRRLVQRLPEWFAFDGVLVLVPSRPASEAGDAWGVVADKTVGKNLIKYYGRSGFEKMVVGMKVGGKYGEIVTVLGRMVEDPVLPVDVVPAVMPDDD
ncbi:hypothetical protein LTR10_005835 [Elasticomyces elasticus]|nr:hypothetical protein LTR10_005835 [Elasticomyces elasticus]KAK4965042.1 hypothetical protein LTR42_012460 [Elasticomyces elasticus]